MARKMFSMSQLNAMGTKGLKALHKQRQKADKMIFNAGKKSSSGGGGKRGNPNHGKDGRFT